MQKSASRVTATRAKTRRKKPPEKTSQNQNEFKCTARRFADTVARATMALTGATEQDIDMIFGWLEAFYSRKMQIHYQSDFDRERRCAVTRLI